MDLSELLRPLVLSIVFATIGLALFAACFLIVLKVTPFSVRKEIEEDQNVALAIIIASMMLGIALIVSAAIH
jgi:putative membrane protein